MNSTKIEKIVKDLFDCTCKIYTEDLKEGDTSLNKLYNANITCENEKQKEKVVKFLKFEIENKEEFFLKLAQENFVNDLIHFRFQNIDLMLNRSEILGFDSYIKRQTLVIEVENLYTLFGSKSEMVIQNFKEEFYKTASTCIKKSNDIVSYIGDNKFIFCKTEECDIEDVAKSLLIRLKSKWDLDYKISIGDLYDIPGIEAVGYSYKDASKYLSLGKLYLPNEKIYSLKNVGLFLVLSGLKSSIKSKIHSYVEDLIEYSHKERKEYKLILENFFENNFDKEKTSKKKSISIEKLDKVLKKTQEITGLDPFNFMDAMKLYVALKTY